MTHRIIVDTDTGIDDAHALLYLLGQDDVELTAITAVYGNTPVDSAVSNIARVLQLAGQPDLPVARGAAGPLVGEAHIAGYVHGIDGLGDIWTDRPTPAGLVQQSAAELIVELVHANPGELDLLFLGPLTNGALALQLDPQLFTLVRSVVVMGGSGPFPRLGDVLMVDANVQNDGEAARAVFSAPRTSLLQVGVNVTARAIVEEEVTERLRASGTAWGEFSARILDAYHEFYRFAWGRNVSPAHDTLAAALLLHPEWITKSVTGPVTITGDGYTTRAHVAQTWEGEPLVWATDDAPPTVAVTDADFAAFLHDFERVLSSR